MQDFSGETYQNLLKTMLARVPDTYDKRDTSPIQTALGPAAWALEGFYIALDQIQQQAFIQTAVGESLDNLAVLAGLTRYPASAAVRLGVFNTSVPIGSRFSTAGGEPSINFAVTAATDTANQYQLTAETPGTVGNEYTGQILPITAIPGLTSAQITNILIPGDDEETDDELRARLIAALNQRPFGGNIASYREAVLAMDGVGAVQIYPTWDGGGTVKVSVMGADYAPASEELVESVQIALDPPPNQGLGLGLAPIGAKATVVSPSSVTVNVAATLTLSSGTVIGQVQEAVEASIGNYLLSIRQGWGTTTSGLDYSANVYVSRVTAAIVSTSGVVNATNVTVNGGTEDLILTQSGTVQQVPVLGTVSLTDASGA